MYINIIQCLVCPLLSNKGLCLTFIRGVPELMAQTLRVGRTYNKEIVFTKLPRKLVDRAQEGIFVGGGNLQKALI